MNAATSLARPSLSSLLLRTLPSLRHILTPTSCLAALDISDTHVSLALTDRSRNTAFPFGLLSRTSKPSADALIFSSALSRQERDSSLDIHALIVGLSPIAREPPIAYVDALLREEALLPDLKGVLFYSEVHAVAHAVRAQDDYLRTANVLPDSLESRKLKRFEAAMNPKVPSEQLQHDFDSKARVSATEILQAVLDDLKRLQ